MTTQAIPKFLFADEQTEELFDKRIAKIIKYEEMDNNEMKKVEYFNYHNQLQIPESIQERLSSSSLNNLAYASTLGHLFMVTTEGVAALTLQQLDISFQSGKLAKSTILIPEVGQIFLSDSEQLLAVVNETNISIFQLKEQIHLKTKIQNKEKLCNAMWQNNDKFYLWNYLSNLYLLNVNKNQLVQVEGVNECTGIDVLNQDVVVMENMNVLFVEGVEVTQTIQLGPIENDDQPLWEFCTLLSVIKINNRASKDFKDDDVYALVAAYYTAYEEDDTEPCNRYLFFMKGDLKSGEVSIRGNELISAYDEPQDKYYEPDNSTKKQFTVQHHHFGKFITVAVQKLNFIFIIDADVPYDDQHMFSPWPKHEFRLKAAEGDFKAFTVMKNMLPSERKTKSENEVMKKVCEKYNGEFMLFYFAHKETECKIEFPPSILALTDKLLYRKFAASTVGCCEEDSAELIDQYFQKVKNSRYLLEPQKDVSIHPFKSPHQQSNEKQDIKQEQLKQKQDEPEKNAGQLEEQKKESMQVIKEEQKQIQSSPAKSKSQEQQREEHQQDVITSDKKQEKTPVKQIQQNKSQSPKPAFSFGGGKPLFASQSQKQKEKKTFIFGEKEKSKNQDEKPPFLSTSFNQFSSFKIGDTSQASASIFNREAPLTNELKKQNSPQNSFLFPQKKNESNILSQSSFEKTSQNKKQPQKIEKRTDEKKNSLIFSSQQKVSGISPNQSIFNAGSQKLNQKSDEKKNSSLFQQKGKLTEHSNQSFFGIIPQKQIDKKEKQTSDAAKKSTNFSLFSVQNKKVEQNKSIWTSKGNDEKKIPNIAKAENKKNEGTALKGQNQEVNQIVKECSTLLKKISEKIIFYKNEQQTVPQLFNLANIKALLKEQKKTEQSINIKETGFFNKIEKIIQFIKQHEKFTSKIQRQKKAHYEKEEFKQKLKRVECETGKITYYINALLKKTDKLAIFFNEQNRIEKNMKRIVHTLEKNIDQLVREGLRIYDEIQQQYQSELQNIQYNQKPTKRYVFNFNDESSSDNQSQEEVPFSKIRNQLKSDIKQNPMNKLKSSFLHHNFGCVHMNLKDRKPLFQSERLQIQSIEQKKQDDDLLFINKRKDKKLFQNKIPPKRESPQSKAVIPKLNQQKVQQKSVICSEQLHDKKSQDSIDLDDIPLGARKNSFVPPEAIQSFKAKKKEGKETGKNQLDPPKKQEKKQEEKKTQNNFPLFKKQGKKQSKLEQKQAFGAQKKDEGTNLLTFGKGFKISDKSEEKNQSSEKQSLFKTEKQEKKPSTNLFKPDQVENNQEKETSQKNKFNSFNKNLTDQQKQAKKLSDKEPQKSQPTKLEEKAQGKPEEKKSEKAPNLFNMAQKTQNIGLASSNPPEIKTIEQKKQNENTKQNPFQKDSNSNPFASGSNQKENPFSAPKSEKPGWVANQKIQGSHGEVNQFGTANSFMNQANVSNANMNKFDPNAMSFGSGEGKSFTSVAKNQGSMFNNPQGSNPMQPRNNSGQSMFNQSPQPQQQFNAPSFNSGGGQQGFGNNSFNSGGQQLLNNSRQWNASGFSGFGNQNNQANQGNSGNAGFMSGMGSQNPIGGNMSMGGGNSNQINPAMFQPRK